MKIKLPSLYEELTNMKTLWRVLFSSNTARWVPIHNSYYQYSFHVMSHHFSCFDIHIYGTKSSCRNWPVQQEWPDHSDISKYLGLLKPKSSSWDKMLYKYFKNNLLVLYLYAIKTNRMLYKSSHNWSLAPGVITARSGFFLA